MTTLREALPNGTLKFLSTGFIRREIWTDLSYVGWIHSDKTRLYDDDVEYAIMPGAMTGGFDPDVLTEANYRWLSDNIGDLLNSPLHRFEWANSTEWCADLDGPACYGDYGDEDCTCLADIFNLDYPVMDDDTYDTVEQEIREGADDYMVPDLRNDITRDYPDSTMLDDVDDDRLGELLHEAEQAYSLYPEIEGMSCYHQKSDWRDIKGYVIDRLRKQ